MVGIFAIQAIRMQLEFELYHIWSHRLAVVRLAAQGLCQLLRQANGRVFGVVKAKLSPNAALVGRRFDRQYDGQGVLADAGQVLLRVAAAHAGLYVVDIDQKVRILCGGTGTVQTEQSKEKHQ